MEKKMNVADFATLVGTTSKTIYGKIQNYGDLPVNEQLKTVREKVKGREVTLIVTNSEQIEYYKNLYGKNTVNEGEYYETLTDNNGYEHISYNPEILKTANNNEITVNILNQFITVNNDLNDRYEQKITEYIKVNNELAELKSQQLLLEDKAGREGMYLNEINELKQSHIKEIADLKHLHTDEIKELKEDNKGLQRLLSIFKYLFITVTIILLMLITVLITVNKLHSHQTAQPDEIVEQTLHTK